MILSQYDIFTRLNAATFVTFLAFPADVPSCIMGNPCREIRGVPDCVPVNNGLKRRVLKDFGGKFYSHNYFDDVGVDSNSGTICMYKGQDVLAL